MNVPNCANGQTFYKLLSSYLLLNNKPSFTYLYGAAFLSVTPHYFSLFGFIQTGGHAILLDHKELRKDSKISILISLYRTLSLALISPSLHCSSIAV